MRIKVVLSRATLDLLWALGDRRRKWIPGEFALNPDEAIVELDEEVVAHTINNFDDLTLDEAIRRFAHDRLTRKRRGSR